MSKNIVDLALEMESPAALPCVRMKYTGIAIPTVLHADPLSEEQRQRFWRDGFLIRCGTGVPARVRGLLAEYLAGVVDPWIERHLQRPLLLTPRPRRAILLQSKQQALE